MAGNGRAPEGDLPSSGRPAAQKTAESEFLFRCYSDPVKAFLDTTILADTLLKVGPDRDRAKASFARYEALLVPAYATKEFKRGVLRAYIWLHNKAVTTERWADAIASIETVWQQRNLNRTATRAVADFTSSMAVANAVAREIPRDGPEFHRLQTREARIWLKTKIFSAWRQRGKAPFTQTNPLPCYALTGPRETLTGVIDNKPMACTLGSCCLRGQFAKDLEALERLEAVCATSTKPEMLKRRKVLRSIRRRPLRELDENQCLVLGDAVFAMQCPPDAVVLTTNLSDHELLANAIDKRAEAP